MSKEIAIAADSAPQTAFTGTKRISKIFGVDITGGATKEVRIFDGLQSSTVLASLRIPLLKTMIVEFGEPVRFDGMVIDNDNSLTYLVEE